MAYLVTKWRRALDRAYQQEHRELRCWATPGTIWAPRPSDALLYWPSWQEHRRLGNQTVGEGEWQCEAITTAS
jgi:hypothetical protein